MRYCCISYTWLTLLFQESDDGIHDNIALHHCDELTRNAQTILQLLHFGAFKEVLHIVSVFFNVLNYLARAAYLRA